MSRAEAWLSSHPPTSQAPLLSAVSRASVRAAAECVHAVTVHGHSPGDGRDGGFTVGAEERRAWLLEAARRGASLVVLSSPDGLELFSTERDRKKALSSVMRALKARMEARPGLGRARVVTRTGSGAVRHLFARVAGLEASRVRPFVMHVHAAALEASSVAALGPTLSAVFRGAASVNRRVRLEAAGIDPTESLDALAALGAERIVEEELAAWQTQEAELCRVEEVAEQWLGRVGGEDLARDPRAFVGEEPGSHVRIRVEDFLDGARPRVSLRSLPPRAR